MMQKYNSLYSMFLFIDKDFVTLYHSTLNIAVSRPNSVTYLNQAPIFK